ncbi:MAG: hypothetical protein FWB73_06250 [Treponema sp.]|nr:hypothetical protein [Treponema sp.]
MKKLLGLVCIFVIVLLSSCDLLGDLFGLNKGKGSGTWYEGDPDYGNFWAINMKSDNFYRVSADLFASGNHCEVWVEKNCGITTDQAAQIKNHFDNVIYPKMIANFSLSPFVFEDGGDTYNFNNIMEFASWFVDGNGKLCILLLDIKDNFGSNDRSYTAGYFLPADFIETNGSNKKNIIYIDTNPSMFDSNNKLTKIEEAYGTLAHEMQHMMNFATTLVNRMDYDNEGKLISIGYMDTWVDEGLSAAAEYITSDEHSASRIEWFNKNGGGNGRIDRGNNFFVWGNNNSVLDDYSTVYLFFQWLRIHGKPGVYKDIISSEYSDYNAVVNAMKPNYQYWESLLETWLAANYINDPNSSYGYGSDEALMTVKAPAPASASIASRVLLAPGEGVYSKANSNPTLIGQGANIKNVYINNKNLVNNYTQGSVLLTFNSNTNNKGSVENGATTGTPITSISTGRSVMSEISGPVKIDARDLLGRDRFNKDLLINARRLLGDSE